MLPASRRLRLTRDFEHVFSGGRTINSGICRIKALRNQRNLSRYAVVVSTKVSKRAVIRNRVRRRFWAAISAFELLVPTGLDIVVIAFPEAAKSDFSFIKQELNSLLVKRLSKN